MATKPHIKLCLVIGDSVAQSLSPKMHNAAYKALGIDDEYLFQAVKVPKEGLEKFVEKAKTTTHFMAVTIPHKEAIMPMLDKVDTTAKKIGAVNSVMNVKGKLIGYNTDYIGAIESLKQHCSLSGKKVAVLGSGGSARAIVYGLVKEKCEVTIYSRNKKKAAELAKIFGCECAAWEKRDEAKSADIIVNTTPIGKDDNSLPIDEKHIKKGQIIFDINYGADGTPLFNAAKKKKAIAIDGLEMLLRQGMKQFELYTGEKAPEEIMRKAIQHKPIYESTI